MFEEMIGQWEYLGSIPVRAQFVKVNQKSPKDMTPGMKNLVPGEGMLTLDQSLCSWLTATANVRKNDQSVGILKQHNRKSSIRKSQPEESQDHEKFGPW